MFIVRSLIAVSCLLVTMMAAGSAFSATEKPTITIATTDQSSVRVAGEGPDIDPQLPGWQIELFRLVADKIGVTFKFQRMPWVQALDRVRKGETEAVFNSSFNADRAVYGVYPTRNGMLDHNRATLRYTYWLYTRSGSPVTWNGQSFGALNNPIGAERSSAIVPMLKNRGAKVVEVGRYQDILSLMMDGHVDAIAGFEGNVETILQANPQQYSQITRHPVPLLRRTGYLMFSKTFYEKNMPLAERIWDTVAEVWASPIAAEIQRNYE